MCLLSRSELFPNPFRIAPAIQHGFHTCRFLLELVVDGEREYLTKQAMNLEDTAVNASMNRERVDIGEKRIQEIFSKAGLLVLIERKATSQVLAGGGQNLNFHNKRSRRSRLASSQLT